MKNILTNNSLSRWGSQYKSNMKQRTILKTVLLACVALMGTASLVAQPKGLKKYWNEKNQYSVYVPESFNGMGESDSGDGQVFVSPDGDTHIRVYGGYNAQTLLGTSFDEEYQLALKQLKDRKVELLETSSMDDPDEEFDWSYAIQYVEDGLYHSLRSVWWGDRFATVDFWCYKEDKARYMEDPGIDAIVYSLGPDDGRRHSESDKVLEWASAEDYFINVYPSETSKAGGQPNIQNFFNGFATSFQTPLTLLGLEKSNDPAFQSEDIAEWILDNKNDYMMLQLVNDGDYWMEACTFDKENGHKLFLVNYNAPNQALLCFDYNPEEQVAHVDHQTLQLLQRLPKAIVRLPRQGQTMEIYYYKDLSKPVCHLTWNGHGFEVKHSK